jgi:hypothetical protein
MTTLDSSPSNNGRGSDAWSRPGTDLGIDRRGAGYCRVTFDHAPMNVTGATVCIPPAPSPHDTHSRPRQALERLRPVCDFTSSTAPSADGPRLDASALTSSRSKAHRTNERRTT